MTIHSSRHWCDFLKEKDHRTKSIVTIALNKKFSINTSKLKFLWFVFIDSTFKDLYDCVKGKKSLEYWRLPKRFPNMDLANFTTKLPWWLTENWFENDCVSCDLYIATLCYKIFHLIYCGQYNTSLTQECSWSLNIQIWLFDRNVVSRPKTMWIQKHILLG